MFDDLDVTSVHVHEGALLLVVCLPLREAGLQQSHGVRELSSAASVLHLRALGSLGLVQLGIVTLLQFLLQVHDLVLKSELIDFVLSFQSKNLVVGVLAETLSVVRLRVQFLDFLHSLVDLAAIALVHTVLVTQLLAPDVDFVAEGLVLRLQVVELVKGLLATVLVQLNFVLFLLELSIGGAVFFDLLAFLL